MSFHLYGIAWYCIVFGFFARYRTVMYRCYSAGELPRSASSHFDKVLLDNYDNQHNLASTGFHLGGQKYFYLRYLKSTFTSGTSKVLAPGEPQSICKQWERWCDAREARERRSSCCQDQSGKKLRYLKQWYKSWSWIFLKKKIKNFNGENLKIPVLQAVILGLYEDPMQPAEAATVTETLGDYLKGVGY